MAISVGSNQQQKAEINVTPMIDVLLVLIIIFMIITPLVPKGLQALVPEPPQKNDVEPERYYDIVLTVHRDGTVYLNQEQIAIADLRSRLANMFRTSSNRVVFVRGDRDLEFREVAEVIDIAKGAGLNRVALWHS